MAKKDINWLQFEGDIDIIVESEGLVVQSGISYGDKWVNIKGHSHEDEKNDENGFGSIVCSGVV